MKTPLLLGHRGLRAAKLAKENSFAAFDLALQHGCDGFEFDVRLTGCGRALVCHNPRIGTVTVSRASRHQLRDVPQLEDVLGRYGQRVFLDIELKVSGLEKQLLDALRGNAPARDYVVSSFIPGVIMEVVARSGSTPTGIICEKPAELRHWPHLPVEYVIVHHSLIEPSLIEDVHDAKRKIVAWTVNDAGSMTRLAELGVDAIISDNPELLVRTLKPSKTKTRPKTAKGSKSVTATG